MWGPEKVWWGWECPKVAANGQAWGRSPTRGNTYSKLQGVAQDLGASSWGGPWALAKRSAITRDRTVDLSRVRRM